MSYTCSLYCYLCPPCFELFDLLHCILYLDILFLYDHIQINLKQMWSFHLLWSFWRLTELRTHGINSSLRKAIDVCTETTEHMVTLATPSTLFECAEKVGEKWVKVRKWVKVVFIGVVIGNSYTKTKNYISSQISQCFLSHHSSDAIIRCKSVIDMSSDSYLILPSYPLPNISNSLNLTEHLMMIISSLKKRKWSHNFLKFSYMYTNILVISIPPLPSVSPISFPTYILSPP